MKVPFLTLTVLAYSVDALVALASSDRLWTIAKRNQCYGTDQGELSTSDIQYFVDKFQSSGTVTTAIDNGGIYSATQNNVLFCIVTQPPNASSFSYSLVETALMRLTHTCCPLMEAITWYVAFFSFAQTLSVSLLIGIHSMV